MSQTFSQQFTSSTQDEIDSLPSTLPMQSQSGIDSQNNSSNPLRNLLFKCEKLETETSITGGEFVKEVTEMITTFNEDFFQQMREKSNDLEYSIHKSREEIDELKQDSKEWTKTEILKNIENASVGHMDKLLDKKVNSFKMHFSSQSIKKINRKTDSLIEDFKKTAAIDEEIKNELKESNALFRKRIQDLDDMINDTAKKLRNGIDNDESD